ncbi:MAG: hypothetical protein EBU90_17015 [Proteobacteria bacterium]|nr:hypothetical protein [Pseudomonadota bacterium]
MISIIHYISARRRLEEADKTIRMLGGDREAPPMVRAQRDMIYHEVEYYKEKVGKLGILTVIFGGIVLVLFSLYNLFGAMNTL